MSPQARVLAVLPSEAWAFEDDIARKAGLTIDTTRTVLDQLLRQGLAGKLGSIWKRRP